MLTLLALLSLFVYLLLGWHFCQTRLAGKHALNSNISLAALGIGLTAHGIVIANTLLQSPTFFGAAEALSLTAWLAILIYCLGRIRWNLDGLEPPLFAFSAAFMALALALPQGHLISYAQSGLSRVHFMLAMFAQSFLFIAAGLAVLMRLTDSTLHHHARKLLARKLPPLLTLEKLLFGTITTGFTLLTIALIAGALLNQQAHGIVVQWSHKTVFGLSSWLLFGGLLLGNHIKGWRGRFAANWTLVAFAVLFLGYIGTRIVLEAFLSKG
ncbi:cytochrome c biogenesis protein CcsA [Chitinibacter fontanus]|uniref:Cytochrome c biogenesis protein CcsA n=1 Tax=Chitinibacter fontanus TaxID=1737446 RepID=A0A7D5ZHF3_9NEIS|nr:cytochrome c biogenesis protein CcsA [Chitinibacter fontanus]QLI81949.1 cytochrome c biogenesis protein CcsA [Chitinibacter fontanus]